MQSSTLELTPIGYFHSLEVEKYDLPRQAGAGKNNFGKIILNSHSNFEQALDDLSDFDRIWILFWFNKNSHWSPKVLTPHGPPKRGVFATRSPYRPNPIGLSCLELIKIDRLEIYITNHDLLDQTPILDIKPYLSYADAWPEAKQGWLSQSSLLEVTWSLLAEKQMQYLEQQELSQMRENILLRLKTNPYPTKSNRVKKLESNLYQLAYKTWRILYKITENQIEILSIASGYDKETLSGNKTSLWDDVPVHLNFNAHFFL